MWKGKEGRVKNFLEGGGLDVYRRSIFRGGGFWVIRDSNYKFYIMTLI